MRTNPYKTVEAQVVGLEQATQNHLLATIVPEDPKKIADFRCGQFLITSLPGIGEHTHTIASAPGNPHIKIPAPKTLQRHLKIGQVIGVRGPYGRGVSKKITSNNLVAIATGQGIFPLRSLLLHLKPLRLFEYNVFIDTGKNPSIQEKFELFKEKTRLRICSPQDPQTNLMTQLESAGLPIPSNALLYTSPSHYLKILPLLIDKGVMEKDVYVHYMGEIGCGIGKCQKCVRQKTYFCRSGPIFPLKEIKPLLGDLP